MTELMELTELTEYSFRKKPKPVRDIPSIPLILLFFFLSFACTAQNIFTISGSVSDSANQQVLSGVVVRIMNTNTSTESNSQGNFQIKSKAGKQEIQVSLLGYKTISQTFFLRKDTTISFSLASNSEIEEVVVSANKSTDFLKNTQMGTVEITAKEMKNLPVLLGETDPLKVLQLTPGIISAGDGNTGFYVRGGSPDQNLVQLNDVTIYNPSHLLGFFSVFNPDIISNVKITKAGMPVEAGGRLASVTEIEMSETDKPVLQGGLGVLASRIAYQTPALKNKANFCVAARRTYIDLVTKPIINNFMKKSSSYQGNSYYFYDFNLNFNYRLNAKNRLYFMLYHGKDLYSLSNESLSFSNSISWGNTAISAKWTHLFNKNFSVRTTAFYSSYFFNLTAEKDKNSFEMVSKIEDYSVKTDFIWTPNEKHIVKYGIIHSYRIFHPGNKDVESPDAGVSFTDKYMVRSHETNVYLGDYYTITEKISLSGGIRLTNYAQVGPYDKFITDDAGQILDTTFYKKNEVIKNYSHAECRFAFRYAINPISSFKISYTQNYQYIHLASIGSVSLPTDIWLPSSYKIKPQKGIQYAAGYYASLFNNYFTLNIEAYYKKFKNVIEFRHNIIQRNTNLSLDESCLFGEGQSAGLEFFLKKEIGKYTGWISYTLSKTTRKFAEINNGNSFSAKYDRRHDIALVFMYKINPRWDISVVFVYASGDCLTLPESRMMIQGTVVNYYGKPNSFRMPAYHRLDLGATYILKKRKRYESSLNFSIYNVYSRANPYYVYFEVSGDISKYKLQTQAKQVSIMPILPSVTWNFKF